MKFKFFVKQSNYLWLTGWLASCHGFYMTYFFPRQWAESDNATVFINAVASVVPALHSLKEHIPPYTPYWGVFYATFWCLAPLFFAVGAISTFFFSAGYYEKINTNKPLGYVFVFLFFLIVWMIPFFLPFIGNFPSPLFNQMSAFFPLRVLAWWVTGMFTFALGWAVGCCYQRVISNKKILEGEK